MGSFSATCSVSNLPIQVGDEVRVILLTKNSFEDIGCSMSYDWVPRTLPVKGEYNDYGSFDEINRKSILTKLMLQGFKYDLVEKGVGDNTCHDIAVSRKLTLEKLLEGLWEGRISVIYPPDNKYKISYANEDVEDEFFEQRTWIPTFQSVSKVLNKNGFHTTEEKFGGKGGFIVDRPDPNFYMVRIRYSSWENRIEKLKQLKNFLISRGFECVLVPQLNDEEILVFPSLSEDKNEHRYTKICNALKNDPSKLVKPCAIKEEVWQLLLKMKRKDFSSVEEVREFLLFNKKKNKNKDRMQNLLETARMRLSYNRYYPDVVAHVGIMNHLRIAREDFRLTKKQIDEILTAYSELLTVTSALSSIRYTWRPMNTSGDQYSDYESESKFYSKMGSLVQDLKLSYKLEND